MMIAYRTEESVCRNGRPAGRPLRRIATVMILVCMLAAGVRARSAGAAAVTFTWEGADGAAWNDEGNWTPAGGPPDGNTHAVIIAGAAKPASIPAGITLGAMTLQGDFEGPLDMLGSLTICSDAGADGSLTVDSGTLRTAQNVESGISVAGTFTIGSGGTVVVRRSSTTANDGHGAGQTITAGDMVVVGLLHADREGFGNKAGPGKTGVNHGASHGGGGGMRGPTSSQTYEDAFSDPLGPTYGSVREPIALGSGGNVATGLGGGAIRLSVTNHITVDGIISASGTPVARGGAGGSILVEAATMSGSGKVQTIGADSNHSQLGASAGGRISVLLSEGEDFGSVLFEAFGGTHTPWFNIAAAGTVYLERKDGSSTFSELIVDNRGYSAVHHTELDNDGFSLDEIDRITIRNAGNLSVRSNDILDFSQDNIEGDGTGFLTVSDSSGISFPTPFTLSPDYILCLDAPVTADGDWTIPGGAVLSHNFNLHEDIRKLDLTLNGGLTIMEGGSVNVDRKGYAPRTGPGAGGGDGASYGGRGHDATAAYSPVVRMTYGSVLNPTDLGSGAGGRSFGAGAIILSLTGVLNHNGTISAQGGSPGENTGGGSGGTVNISASAVTGSGTISARGGDSQHAAMGSGGGGRIAVVVSEGDVFDEDKFDVRGGSANRRGAAGTIYLQHAGHAPGGGRLVVDNPHTTQEPYILTPLPPEITGGGGEPLDDLKAVTLVVKREGAVGLTSDLTVGDLILERDD